MSFDRSSFNPGARGKGPKRASYRTPDDFSTVEGSNYFDDIASEMDEGDELYVHSTNADATGTGSGAASKLYFISGITSAGVVSLSTGTAIS